MVVPSASLSRYIVTMAMMLLASFVALYHVNLMLKERMPTQQLSISLRKMQWLPNGTSSDGGAELELKAQQELIPWHREEHLPSSQAQGESELMNVTRPLQVLMQEASKYKEELREMKGRMMQLERESHTFKQQLSLSVEFSPLKDATIFEQRKRGQDDHVHHYFMSAFQGRGMEEGPPELFSFPSSILRLENEKHASSSTLLEDSSISSTVLARDKQLGSDGVTDEAMNRHGIVEPRMLCLRGNHTFDGTENAYALAFANGLPPGARFVPGITLISDTYWDFHNPWHSVFNLLQFVYWRIDNKCTHPDNLLLFHQGEYRASMGSWITSLLKTTGLPTSVLSMNAAGASIKGEPPAAMCFEQAVVSRQGIGSMKRSMLDRMFGEARCQARRACGLNVSNNIAGKEDEDGLRHVTVTLMVRHGPRGFLDDGAWQQVVQEQCEVAQNCTLTIIHPSNMTFCEQVEIMSGTNIVLSAHGAQLTNIIFMPRGGSVMELFPSGWLELAGYGQYVFRSLTSSLGLYHEGYWRDPSTPPCPNPIDTLACFLHYKDQPLGINATYIGNWLKDVIDKFQATYSPLEGQGQGSNLGKVSCECSSP